MIDDSKRLISPQISEEDHSSLGETPSAGAEKSLRPSFLKEYVGQRKVVDNLSLFWEAARGTLTLWIMCFWPGPPGSEKPPFPTLLPTKWAVRFMQ